MKKVEIVNGVLVVLAACGALINFQLLQKHIAPDHAPAWFQSICNPEQSSKFNCDKVMETKWAYFNVRAMEFQKRDPANADQPLIPMAELGLVYFGGMFLWFLGIGACSFERRRWHLIPSIIAMLGVLVSLYLLFVMFFRLDAKCIWCMISHGLNLLLLLGIVMMWPKEPVSAVATATEASGEGGQQDHGAAATAIVGGSRPHPSFRLVGITCVAVLVMMYATAMTYAGAQYLMRYKAIRTEIDRMRTDTVSQLAVFRSRPSEHLELRTDDPMRPAPGGPDDKPIMMKLVVYSDFQCPFCRDLARDLEARIVPEFDNLLRIVWKNYPLCEKCNPFVQRNLHPLACNLAKVAEAVRVLRGNEAFWKAHDYLFAHQGHGTEAQFDPKEFLALFDLDADEFKRVVESQEVADRIKADIEMGHKHGVVGTPMMFLGNKRLDHYMLDNADFMMDIKKEFVQRRNAKLRAAAAKNATHTAEHGDDAIPDSQDQQDER